MTRKHKLIQAIAALLLCVMIGFSIFDSIEQRYDTNFNQENILTHIENLTANGPRSIADTEENQQALDYIISELESYGIVNKDTTDTPAYLVQDFVAEDTEYQNWYLKNIIVHIPANSDAAAGDAIMFMAHTDSVPMGTGASDDGAPVSVMLEAVRYYLEQMKNGYTLSNDLVFCFVNGEEYGLYGSKAFMEEFTGFNDIVTRIQFGINLESRGTSGTQIMFETAANNYNTIQMFSEINDNIFTCSIATMIYDMMPNGTDFSNFKEFYQGLNFANILGGENYHTQNDCAENVGISYISQQAMIVEKLIEKLGSFDLSQLYDAEESAIFFSYLNIATVVYNHLFAYILGIVLLLMLIANIILSPKQHNLKRTVRSVVSIVIGLVLTAAVTYGCYELFQLIASLAGVIDSHMMNTITYSNTAIVIGIALTALAVTILTSRLAVKFLSVSYRDLTRAFAYMHAVLGIVLTFVLPDASYLFIFSGLMFMLNELLITCVKKADMANYHLEIFAAALYMPIMMPILILATSALGLTMAYVFGLLFALGIFGFGIYLASVCDGRRKLTPVTVSLSTLTAALVIFLIVSLSKTNASVNLQGKQNIAKLPYDDALVYVVDASGDTEYRIYDLNAYRALTEYAPEMTWAGEYYAGEGDAANVEYTIVSETDGDHLTITKAQEDTTVYLTFENIKAESFTIDDGTTSNTYPFSAEEEIYEMTIHSDCVVTINGGSADVAYKESLRDYEPLIPSTYADSNEKLHFNLWLTDRFVLSN